MSISYLCDGCGHPVIHPVKIGYVIQREYCFSCAEVARGFIEQDVSLREELVQKFKDARDGLIHLAPHTFKLTDVAHDA